MNCFCNKRKEQTEKEENGCKDSDVTRNFQEEGEDQLDGGERSDIREIFRIFDRNNERSISLTDLERAMNFLGMTPTEEEVKVAMTTLDTNENGRVDFQEFYAFMHKELAKIGDAAYVQKEEVLRSAFQLFDRDKSGYIEADELKNALSTLGECLSDMEVEDVMRQADTDGDGRINYEEFVRRWGYMM